MNLKFGLGKKLIFLIEGIVVLVVTLGGIGTFLMSRKVTIDRIQSQLTSIAVLKEGNIKTFVENAKAELEFFSKEGHGKLILVRLLKENKEADRSKLVNDYFPELIQDKRVYNDIFLLNSKGVVVASNNKLGEGKIKNNEEYFTRGLEKTYIQSFYYDQTISETAIIISTPIFDLNGKAIGVLAGRLGLEEISKLMIERSGLGVTGESFLVNSSNLVVTELLKEQGVALKKAIFLPQISTCLEGNSNYEGQEDYHGDLVIGYWHWLPEINSCLVTKIDKSEAFAPLYKTTYVSIVMAVVIAIVVGVFGYKAGLAITGPIIKLRNFAIQVKEGNFDIHSDIKSKDEVGEMAVVFDEMVAQLKISYSNLEKKVQDRTSEINLKLSLIEGQNKRLDDNKSAMLNLLEDSKKLEEELKIEKESVEKKVVERTKEVGEEKAKLMASIEALSKAFVMIGLNEEIVLVNENLNKIFNSTKQNWTMSDIQEQLGNSFDFAKAYKNNILEKKKIIYDDIAFGSRILQIRFSPVFTDSAGEKIISGVLAIIGDLTDEKVLARSKDEFFSIASHELRTPLTAIRGNTSMMLEYYKEAFKDPELKQMMVDTHEASIRLIGIVNDFLDMSRLEMSKIEFKLEKVNMVDVINETLKEYEVTGSRNKLSLELITPTEDIPLVLADRNRIKQVLINLVGNGIKFTKEGGISIELKKNKEYVEVRVIDTGMGIPLASQSLLFRKFQQAGESTITRDGAKGTGLGLYISKLMVEGMRGKIYLEKSVEGKGSVFTFTLPIAKVD